MCIRDRSGNPFAPPTREIKGYRISLRQKGIAPPIGQKGQGRVPEDARRDYRRRRRKVEEGRRRDVLRRVRPVAAVGRGQLGRERQHRGEHAADRDARDRALIEVRSDTERNSDDDDDGDDDDSGWLTLRDARDAKCTSSPSPHTSDPMHGQVATNTQIPSHAGM